MEKPEIKPLFKCWLLKLRSIFLQNFLIENDIIPSHYFFLEELFI